MKERDEAKKEDDDNQPPPASKPAEEHAYSKDGLSVNDMRKRGIGGKKISNKTHFSPADPDATLSDKAGESKALAYKTHTSIDASSRVVIDCHVTTGAVSDVTMFIERVADIQKTLGLKIGEVVADRGYGSTENLRFLEDQGVASNIPLWSTNSGGTFFEKLEAGFMVSVDGKEVPCPQGHQMKHSFSEKSTGREIFMLPRPTCMACPKAKDCLTDHEQRERGKKFSLINEYKIITTTHEKSKDPVFKSKLWQRMWKMEGVFCRSEITSWDEKSPLPLPLPWPSEDANSGLYDFSGPKSQEIGRRELLFGQLTHDNSQENLFRNLNFRKFLRRILKTSIFSAVVQQARMTDALTRDSRQALSGARNCAA
jgi:hypothetical protein